MRMSPGDTIMMEAAKHSAFYPGVPCEVVEVDENGAITKIKSLLKDERLLRMGFFLEGDEYVVFNYTIITPN